MAHVTEFYIPSGFRKQVQWIPPAERGKVLEFPAETRKSAPRDVEDIDLVDLRLFAMATECQYFDTAEIHVRSQGRQQTRLDETTRPLERRPSWNRRQEIVNHSPCANNL